MIKNILQNDIITITLDDSTDLTSDKLLDRFPTDLDRIYSYFVTSNYNGTIFESWTISYCVSETDANNTITVCEAVEQILSQILSDKLDKNHKMIGFALPPLELMLELYEPFIKKYSNILASQWKLEMEDVSQICKMVFCILYNNKYYIHKNLLVKSFTNEVLKYVASERDCPGLVSIDDALYYDSDNTLITYGDIIPDDKNDYEDMEQKELIEQKKKSIISVCGQRTYDMLLKDFEVGTVSYYSNTILKRLKKKLGGNKNEVLI